MADASVLTLGPSPRAVSGLACDGLKLHMPEIAEAGLLGKVVFSKSPIQLRFRCGIIPAFSMCDQSRSGVTFR